MNRELKRGTHLRNALGALYKLMPTDLMDSRPSAGAAVAATMRGLTPREAQAARYLERMEVRREGMSTSEEEAAAACSLLREEESLAVGKESTIRSTCSRLV